MRDHAAYYPLELAMIWSGHSVGAMLATYLTRLGASLKILLPSQDPSLWTDNGEPSEKVLFSLRPALSKGYDIQAIEKKNSEVLTQYSDLNKYDLIFIIPENCGNTGYFCNDQGTGNVLETGNGSESSETGNSDNNAELLDAEENLDFSVCFVIPGKGENLISRLIMPPVTGAADIACSGRKTAHGVIDYPIRYLEKAPLPEIDDFLASLPPFQQPLRMIHISDAVLAIAEQGLALLEDSAGSAVPRNCRLSGKWGWSGTIGQAFGECTAQLKRLGKAIPQWHGFPAEAAGAAEQISSLALKYEEVYSKWLNSRAGGAATETEFGSETSVEAGGVIGSEGEASIDPFFDSVGPGESMANCLESMIIMQASPWNLRRENS
ncbi:MAG: hypothetical protein CVV64_15040 [Candidatus Wallbacteria bacterium HGW-Wallbacteria-1]|uniref:Uncharacterized protein n=1 Tax=Candidatus Wallbacteria bacterium HGW-Wallbacteria-1 TaxID=2013854 RepID=A0A2N1PLZ8_9BACT|nr:MAG: hypothetical protein CVV64_15040 [Candidatus Wallbacteria bacterium HGW-Wallbacteria-1]